MAIVTSFSGLQICLTTEFYQLLRGFLERNLGDQLVPIPETIPIEILQKPVSSFVSFWGAFIAAFSLFLLYICFIASYQKKVVLDF